MMDSQFWFAFMIGRLAVNQIWIGVMGLIIAPKLQQLRALQSSSKGVRD